MEQLIFSLNATIPVFLVMVIGYLLKVFHVVDDHFIKVLNSFNFKVTTKDCIFHINKDRAIFTRHIISNFTIIAF